MNDPGPWGSRRPPPLRCTNPNAEQEKCKYNLQGLLSSHALKAPVSWNGPLRIFNHPHTICGRLTPDLL